MSVDYDPPEDRELSKTFACFLLIAIVSVAIAVAMPAKAETQMRDGGAFDTVVLKGAAKLTIAIGAKPSLQVEGDGGTLGRTSTEVHDNRLVIDVKQEGWPIFGRSGERPNVRVTLPHLAALELAGASEVAVDGLAGGQSKIAIDGAGQVKAHGRLDAAQIVVNGAGDVDFADVVTDDARAVVNGVGHIRVRARQALAATVNGVGSVEYSGNPPKVDFAIHGVGSIQSLKEADASR